MTFIQPPICEKHNVEKKCYNSTAGWRCTLCYSDRAKKLREIERKARLDRIEVMVSRWLQEDLDLPNAIDAPVSSPDDRSQRERYLGDRLVLVHVPSMWHI